MSTNFTAIKTFIEIQDAKADLYDKKLSQDTARALIGVFKPELNKLANFIDAQISLLCDNQTNYLPRLVPVSLQELVGRTLPVVRDMQRRPLKKEIATALDRIFACPCLERSKSATKSSVHADPQVATLVKALLVRPLIGFMDDYYSCLYNLDEAQDDREPDWLGYKPEEAIDLSDEFDDIESGVGDSATMEGDEISGRIDREQFLHSAGFNAAIIARTLSHMDDPLVTRALFDEFVGTDGVRKTIRLNILENFDYLPNDIDAQETIQRQIIDNYGGLGAPAPLMAPLAQVLARYESIEAQDIQDEFLEVIDKALGDTINPDNARAALVALTRTRLNSWVLGNHPNIFDRLIELVEQPPDELIKGEAEEAKAAYTDVLRLYAASILSRFQFVSEEHSERIFDLLRDEKTAEYGAMILLANLSHDPGDKKANEKLFSKVIDLLSARDIDARTISTLFRLLVRIPAHGPNLLAFNRLHQALEERTQAADQNHPDQHLDAYLKYCLEACFVQFAKSIRYSPNAQFYRNAKRQYISEPLNRALKQKGMTEEGLKAQSASIAWLDIMGKDAIPAMYKIARVSPDLAPQVANYIHNSGAEAIPVLIKMLKSKKYDYSDKFFFVDNLISLIYDNRCLMNFNLDLDTNPDQQDMRTVHDLLLARSQGRAVEQEDFDQALSAVAEFAVEVYDNRKSLNFDIDLDAYFYSLIHPLGNRAKSVLLRYIQDYNGKSGNPVGKLLRELGYLPSLV